MQTLYNFTTHRQDPKLAKVALEFGLELELAPRLPYLDDTGNYLEIKHKLFEELKKIPMGSNVLLGGLGQYQALMMELPFHIWFTVADKTSHKPKTIVQHVPWSLGELMTLLTISDRVITEEELGF